MDDDESGLISYMEFAGMVREELLLGHKELPEKVLKAAWLALDNDGSGRLTAGEFGAFQSVGKEILGPFDQPHYVFKQSGPYGAVRGSGSHTSTPETTPRSAP